MTGNTRDAEETGRYDDHGFPERRAAECSDENAQRGLRGFEISFAILVSVTDDQYRRLRAWVEEVVGAPWNTPDKGLHWLSTEGARPRWDPRGEPTYDDSVVMFSSTARSFQSIEEEQREYKRRSASSTRLEKSSRAHVEVSRGGSNANTFVVVGGLQKVADSILKPLGVVPVRDHRGRLKGVLPSGHVVTVCAECSEERCILPETHSELTFHWDGKTYYEYGDR